MAVIAWTQCRPVVDVMDDVEMLVTVIAWSVAHGSESQRSKLPEPASPEHALTISRPAVYVELISRNVGKHAGNNE